MRFWTGVTFVTVMLAVRSAGAVEGGKEDRSTTFAVSVIEGGPSAPSLRCSGTLISPGVVLTVRHCVVTTDAALDRCDIDLGPPERELWVGASPWVLRGEGWHKVKSTIVPEPTKLCGNDLALLVLEEPISASEATPARVATHATEFQALVKTRVLGVSGFGATDVNGGGTGTRRRRNDIDVKCVPGEPGYECGSDLDFIDPSEFTAGSGPCSGDSGAGAMGSGDSSLVFGVLARGKLAETCAEGVYERTDIWSWLIAKTVLDATPEGTSAPEWAGALFPASPHEGDLCRNTPGACGDGAQCASLDGKRSWTCVTSCSATSPCAEGRHCDNGVCLAGAPAAPPPSEGGCRLARSSSETTDGALMLLIAAAALGATARADRRRRSKRVDTIQRAFLAACRIGRRLVGRGAPSGGSGGGG